MQPRWLVPERFVEIPGIRVEFLPGQRGRSAEDAADFIESMLSATARSVQ
jgi:hypothetical protein